MIEIVIILLFAVVQSIFGVGLLVFGTPTFLLLGYSYEETLSILLPCSLVVSLTQIVQGRKEIEEWKITLPLMVLPFVVLGLIILLLFKLDVDIKYFVGVMLVLTSLVRFSGRINSQLHRFFKKNTRLVLAITGLLHGLSNMGGAPLTIAASSVFSEKSRIRTNIAYGYSLMAISQIIVLLLFGRMVYYKYELILVLVSLFTYLFVGNALFKKSNNIVYQHLMTVLIFAFGIVLLVFN